MDKVELMLEELSKKYHELFERKLPIWNLHSEIYSHEVHMSFLNKETQTFIDSYKKEENELFKAYGIDKVEYLKLKLKDLDEDELLEAYGISKLEDLESKLKELEEELEENDCDDPDIEVLEAIEYRIKLIDEMYKKRLKLKTTVWEYTDGCSVEFMHSNDFEPNLRQWLYRYIQDVTLVLDLYGWDFDSLMDNIEYTNSLDIWD